MATRPPPPSAAWCVIVMMTQSMLRHVSCYGVQVVANHKHKAKFESFVCSYHADLTSSDGTASTASVSSGASPGAWVAVGTADKQHRNKIRTRKCNRLQQLNEMLSQSLAMSAPFVFQNWANS